MTIQTTTNTPQASGKSHAQTANLKQQGITRERDGDGVPISQTTLDRRGWTRVSNRLLKELLTEPCRCCHAIYKDEIKALKKKLRGAKRVKR